MDIVCLGELLIDMFPAELGRGLTAVSAFHPKPGGAPANLAVAARRLGADSAFIGKVGDDHFGHFLIDVLKDEGVETRGMRIDPDARTTMALIAMPDQNTAEFIFYRNPGADTRLTPDELDHDLLRSTQLFHFGSLSLTHEPVRSATRAAIDSARTAGAYISFDVNYRPKLWRDPHTATQQILEFVPQVNLLKVNETELALLSGVDNLQFDQESLSHASQVLLKMGPDLIVVTLGQAGSFFHTDNGSARVEAFPVETIDAVGCGDAFLAGVLTRLLKLSNWKTDLTSEVLTEALRYGNAVGALTATRQGVIPALPMAIQVDEYLHTQHV